jgi:ABC-type multidrug transport system ATPase subunit
VLGIDLTTQRDQVRSRVGLLGHQNGLYMDLTVRQNIAFWGSMVGATDSEISSAMSRMNLDGRLADVRASKLSAGQRRRCALASLVVRRAELWLLDEPHAGLDAAGRDELDSLLRDAVKAGATVVLASHELDRATTLASRIVHVDGGVVS